MTHNSLTFVKIIFETARTLADVGEVYPVFSHLIRPVLLGLTCYASEAEVITSEDCLHVKRLSLHRFKTYLAVG